LYRRPKTEYQPYSPFPKEVSNTSENDSSLDDNKDIFSFYSMATDSQLLNCFVHLPIQESLPFQLDFQSIAEAQAQDAELADLRQSKPEKYVQHTFSNDTQVYCYLKEPDAPLKIYLPNAMIQPTIRWYHFALSHPGSTRLKDTIKIHFYNPKYTFL